MKKYEQVTLPETKVFFQDTFAYLFFKEVYLKGLFPSFIEKMSIIVSKNPQILTMDNQLFISAEPQEDTSKRELEIIKNMLVDMQKSQDELMKQVVDYSDSIDIITGEFTQLRGLVEVLQNSLTETLKTITESSSGMEILAQLNKKSIDISDVVKQSEQVISTAETKIAQAPVRPVNVYASQVSTNPNNNFIKVTSNSSELDDLDEDMFEDGLSPEEMRGLVSEFSGK